MTDKQILFDDVDVKDCIAYAKLQEIYLGNTLYKQMEKVCMVKNQPCKFFDCQFKQMARELKAKEQECEELKQWKETVKCLANKTCTCKYINLENGHCSFYNKECTAINQCLYKNQQTLTEIKEIAEHWIYTEVADELAGLILQKINEVIPE